uniref:Uncharacterized protein n=1 Tax=Ciona intestinalis TaxID=7719 RepID=H2XZE0_CIOIN
MQILILFGHLQRARQVQATRSYQRTLVHFVFGYLCFIFCVRTFPFINLLLWEILYRSSFN